jgi:hypothetical protein
MYIYMYIYVYMYIYMYVYVHVCMKYCMYWDVDNTMSLVFEVLIIILYAGEFSPFYSKINFKREYSVII